MKARTFLITTGAIFALAAPAAQANLERLLPAHQKAVVHKVAKKQVAKKHVGTSPLYIVVPGSLGGIATPADDCESSGNNCTDQQLCDLWAMNCDLVGLVSTPVPTVAAPVQSAPATTPVSTPASAPSPAAATDSSTLCPSGDIWNDEYQSCV